MGDTSQDVSDTPDPSSGSVDNPGQGSPSTCPDTTTQAVDPSDLSLEVMNAIKGGMNWAGVEECYGYGPYAKDLGNPPDNSRLRDLYTQVSWTGTIPEQPPETFACFIQGGWLSCVGVTPDLSIIQATVPAHGCTNGPVDERNPGDLAPIVDQGRQKLAMQATIQAQRAAAEALVTRARNGDQNAMAIISLVQKNAQTSPIAASARQAIIEYIQNNPPASFNGEARAPAIPNLALYRASEGMSRGPLLTNGHVSNIVRVFGGRKSRNHRLVMHGISRFGNEQALQQVKAGLVPTDKALIELGQTIGRARALQLVRCGMRPIAYLSRGAAWELGR